MSELVVIGTDDDQSRWLRQISWGEVDVLSEARHLVYCRGRLRAEDSESDLKAENDFEAVSEWLAEIRSLKAGATHEAYRRESARFLRWCWTEHRIALSDLRRADITAYREFLLAPPPSWVMEPGKDSRRKGSLRGGLSGMRKTSAEWRPFVRAMSEKNAAYSIGIIIRMYDWLVGTGYLVRNPFGTAKEMAAAVDTNRSARGAVPVELIHAVSKTIADMDCSSEEGLRKAERARYLITMMCLMGFRVSDFVGNTMDSFYQDRGEWWWRGQRKGARKRGETEDRGKLGLPVSPHVLDAVIRYRHSMNFMHDLGESPPFPMVSDIRAPRALSYKQVYRIVREIFEKTYDRLIQEGQHSKADLAPLREASCHWLRHSFVTAISDSESIEKARDLAGHADLRTTAKYRTVENMSLHKSSQAGTQLFSFLWTE